MGKLKTKVLGKRRQTSNILLRKGIANSTRCLSKKSNGNSKPGINHPRNRGGGEGGDHKMSIKKKKKKRHPLQKKQQQLAGRRCGRDEIRQPFRDQSSILACPWGGTRSPGGEEKHIGWTKKQTVHSWSQRGCGSQPKNWGGAAIAGGNRKRGEPASSLMREV